MTVSAASALASFEEAIGGRLPADYRRFLLAGLAPGRRGEFAAPAGWPGGDPIGLRSFYLLSGGEDRGLELATFTTYAGRIPDVAVPVAATTCGNVLILGYDGLDAGRLWLCDRTHASLRGRLKSMQADLAASGMGGALDSDAVLYYWERLFAQERTWRLGFADTYEVSENFGQLWASVR
jgi:hypothetical protein